MTLEFKQGHAIYIRGQSYGGMYTRTGIMPTASIAMEVLMGEGQL